jgi:hypothetical protein
MLQVFGCLFLNSCLWVSCDTAYLWRNSHILFEQLWCLVTLWVIVKFVHCCIPRDSLWDLVLWWCPRQWLIFQRNLLPISSTLKTEAVFFSITLLTQIRLLKVPTTWKDIASQKTTTTLRHVFIVSLQTKFDWLIIFYSFFVIMTTKMNVGISCADGLCQ